MKQFFHSAWNELNQVTWLTRKQAIHISVITVIFVFSSAIVFWGIDLIFTQLYQVIQ